MSKKLVVKQVSLLWVASMAGAIFAFLTQVIVARIVSPMEFGIYATSLAICSLALPVSHFGVGQYLIKEFGVKGWEAIRYILPAFKLILYNSLAVLSFIILWTLFGPHERNFMAVLLLMSLYVPGQIVVELLSVRYQLEEEYFKLAMWQLLHHLLRLLLIIAIWLMVTENFKVYFVGASYSVVAVLIIFCVSLSIKDFVNGNISLVGHGDKPKFNAIAEKVPISKVVNNSWPFGLATFFHLIYFQSDIIIIGYLIGDAAAGYYNVAFMLIVSMLLFPNILYQKYLLPKIHRWANTNHEMFYEVFRKGNIFMLLVGSLVTFIAFIIAPQLIYFLFGNEYTESIELFRVLLGSIPILFVASSVGSVLVTKDHMKTKVKLMGIVAVVNLLLNFILVPSLGAMGAAYATIASNMVLLILYWYVAKHTVFAEQKA